ncbi:TetR/AcrR family transcriptional regulator [Chitinophaga costaii]|nr:TetR/AcrR family transcriptional regulator [Chitinophaga costaii]
MTIIEAAEKLFAEKGFEGASVRDIAHEANTNVSMISYYFGSKEKLMEAVFDRRMEGSRAQLEALYYDQSLTTFQKIYALIDAYVGKLTSQPYFNKIWMREQVESQSCVIADKIEGVRERNFAVINRIVKDGQELGEFKHEIDCSLMMALLIGTTNQVLNNAKHYRRKHDLEKMSDDDFRTHLKETLTSYLKTVFKALLTYEA